MLITDEVLDLPTVKIWVAPLTTEGERYFETAGMKSVAGAIKGKMEPYHWAVTDGGEQLHINPPVPEGHA